MPTNYKIDLNTPRMQRILQRIQQSPVGHVSYSGDSKRMTSKQGAQANAISRYVSERMGQNMKYGQLANARDAAREQMAYKNRALGLQELELRNRAAYNANLYNRYSIPSSNIARHSAYMDWRNLKNRESALGLQGMMGLGTAIYSGYLGHERAKTIKRDAAEAKRAATQATTPKPQAAPSAGGLGNKGYFSEDPSTYNKDWGY